MPATEAFLREPPDELAVVDAAAAADIVEEDDWLATLERVDALLDGVDEMSDDVGELDSIVGKDAGLDVGLELGFGFVRVEEP
jgi:hypothetical protein